MSSASIFGIFALVFCIVGIGLLVIAFFIIRRPNKNGDKDRKAVDEGISKSDGDDTKRQ